MANDKIIPLVEKMNPVGPGESKVQISEHESKLLIEASASRSGEIRKLITPGRYILHVNGKAFIAKDAREGATWDEALYHLIQYGFLQISGRGDSLKLTNEGYKAADEVKNQLSKMQDDNSGRGKEE